MPKIAFVSQAENLNVGGARFVNHKLETDKAYLVDHIKNQKGYGKLFWLAEDAPKNVAPKAKGKGVIGTISEKVRSASTE